MNLPDLPPSNDDKFWGDGEKHLAINRSIAICQTHKKENYMEHTGYIDNHNGTISCKFCPWGTMLPGYIKLIEGRLKDLRPVSGSQ